MGKVPTSGRKSSYDEDDDELLNDDEQPAEPGRKKRKGRATLAAAREKLADHMHELASRQIAHFSPSNDHEKREAFKKLALLRSAPGNTYEMCAEIFGVSRSTIGNWLADPLYKDICQELQQDARQQGFVTATSLISDNLATLYYLSQNDPSGFVRYSAARHLLLIAGMEQPPVASVTDDKRDVNAFLDKARERASLVPQQINVQINMSPTSESGPGTSVVDALSSAADPNSLLDELEQARLMSAQQTMQEEYEQPLLPGGKLPGSDEQLAERLKQLRTQGDR